MDNDPSKTRRIVQELLEKFTIMGGVVNELRASVNVLKPYVATQLSPGNPELALEALAEMEKKLIATSQDEQERLRTLDLIQSLKEWEKTGSPPGSSA
jgi:hypothetical protein